MTASPEINSRDPDLPREGIFRDYDCDRCKNGTEPCVRRYPRLCPYPRARKEETN